MTFLNTFREYLASRSDSPPSFAVPAGMTALAVAMGNRVSIPGWSRSIYPNIWVVVIAPSGFGKSVPLDLCQDIIERAGFTDAVMPDTFSLEAMIYSFSKNPIAVFLPQEFAAFTDKLNSSYNQGAEQWLTSLYDGGERAGKRRVRDNASEDGWKEISINRPAISMLGASSPEWFAKSFTESGLRGGFYARMIFVPSKVSGPWVGFPGAHDDRVMAELAGHLRRAGSLFGEFDMSRVLSDFNEYDWKSRQELRESTESEFGGIKSRSGTLALKFSMIFHVSRDPTTKVIDPEDFQNAVQWVEGLQRNAMSYLRSQVPRNKPEDLRIRIMEIVGRQLRTYQSDLITELHTDMYELKRAAETLIAEEKIRIEREHDTYRPVFVALPRRSTNGNGNGH